MVQTRKDGHYGHTCQTIPGLVWSPKSSWWWRSQYCGGGPHGNTACRSFLTFLVCFCTSVIQICHTTDLTRCLVFDLTGTSLSSQGPMCQSPFPEQLSPYSLELCRHSCPPRKLCRGQELLGMPKIGVGKLTHLALNRAINNLKQSRCASSLINMFRDMSAGKNVRAE